MNLASQITFWVPYIGTGLVFIILLYYWLRKSKGFPKFLRLSVVIVISLAVLAWISRIILMYFYLKSSFLGDYLTSGLGSFFLQQVWQLSKSILLSFAIAILFYLIGIIIVKRQKKPFIEEEAPKVLFCFALILGAINIFPGLILAIILAILWSLRKKSRVSIIPFIVLSTIIIQILNIFPFYSRLLMALHLM